MTENPSWVDKILALEEGSKKSKEYKQKGVKRAQKP
jgi:hypothetical protein